MNSELCEVLGIPGARMFYGKALEGRAGRPAGSVLARVQRRSCLPPPTSEASPDAPHGRQTTAEPHVYPARPAQERPQFPG